MSETYQTTVPEKMFAGDSLLLDVSSPDCPAGEWTGKIVFSSGTNRMTATASANGTVHRFNITPTSTSAWVAGGYSWQIYAEKTGFRVTIATGYIEIVSDIVSATSGIDVRLFPRKICDALESILSNRATAEQLALVSQSCDNLNVTYMPDVYKEYTRWRSFAEQEEQAGRVAAGMGGPRAIYARFT